MNWNLRFICSILFLSLIMSACKTQKKNAPDGFQNDSFGIKGLTCTEILSPDAIDSKVGILNCGNVSFTYDFGPFSNPGPLTPKEDFRRSFDTYHHIKFFENRMIDPKVYRIFLDSVEVIDVRRKSETDELLFDCKPCNTTAELTFKGDTYYYPMTLSEKQMNMEGFFANFEEKEEYIYKYYQVENEQPSLYITPKKNRFKKKNTLSLVVLETTLSKKEINEIFRSVYLRK